MVVTVDYVLNEVGYDVPMVISVENQTFDEATLRQLREEYDIFFMSAGDAVLPVMVVDGDTHSQMFVIGCADDGRLYFDRKGFEFSMRFHPCWAKGLIKDLEEALRSLEYET